MKAKLTPRMRRRQRRIFLLAVPHFLEVLQNPELVKQLADAGMVVNQFEVDMLRQEHFEEQVRSMGLPLSAVQYRKIGETMQTNGEVLDAKQFLAVIKQAFKESGKPSITQWAESLGVSYQFLSHVMNGDYNPGPAVAKALGYEQIYGFRRKQADISKGVPFSSVDIRKAVAAMNGKKVQPAASKKIISKRQRHGGKKAQAKKK